MKKASVFNIQKFSLHDGPGIRTSIFFSSCNLRCKWCANPECFMQCSSLPQAQEYTIEELLTEVLKDRVFYQKSGGGVTLTGGEVFLQLEFVKQFCQTLKQHGIHVAIETAGSVATDAFCSLIDLVDFVYLDCKHHDAQKHLKGTGVTNEKTLRNMQYLASCGKKHCIRIPVIPGFNDTLADAQAFCALLKPMGVMQIELLPFHQFGESKYEKAKQPYVYAGVPPLHAEELRPYLQVFIKQGLPAILK